MMRERSMVMGAAAVVLALVTAACSPSEPDYCEQRQAVDASWDALTGTDVVAEGTDTLSQRFDDFSADLVALDDAARGDFPDEVAAVEEALGQLESGIDELGELNVGAAAEQIQAGLTSLQPSIDALERSLSGACE